MRGLMAVTKSLTSMSRMNQEELKELFGLSSLPENSPMKDSILKKQPPNCGTI